MSPINVITVLAAPAPMRVIPLDAGSANVDDQVAEPAETLIVFPLEALLTHALTLA